MYPNVDIAVERAGAGNSASIKRFRSGLAKTVGVWERLEVKVSLSVRTNGRDKHKALSESLLVQCRNPAALDFVRQEVEKAVWKLHNVKLEPPPAFVGRDGSDVGKK
jgi:hypothetical protein